MNYVKNIDIYLIGCFLFVFATLVEYAIVLLLSSQMKKSKGAQKKKDREKKEEKAREARHKNNNQKVGDNLFQKKGR